MESVESDSRLFFGVVELSEKQQRLYAEDPGRLVDELELNVLKINDLYTKRKPGASVRKNGKLTVRIRLYLIVDKFARAAIGTIALIPEARKTDQFQVSYWVHEDYRGRGAATAALARLQNLLSHDNRSTELVAYVSPTNEASNRLLRISGFTLIAHDEQFQIKTWRWRAPTEPPS